MWKVGGDGLVFWYCLDYNQQVDLVCIFVLQEKIEVEWNKFGVEVIIWSFWEGFEGEGMVNLRRKIQGGCGCCFRFLVGLVQGEGINRFFMVWG